MGTVSLLDNFQTFILVLVSIFYINQGMLDPGGAYGHQSWMVKAHKYLSSMFVEKIEWFGYKSDGLS